MDMECTLVLKTLFRHMDRQQQAAFLKNKEGMGLKMKKQEIWNGYSLIMLPGTTHNHQSIAKDAYNNPSISQTIREIRGQNAQKDLTNLLVPPQLHTSCSAKRICWFQHLKTVSIMIQKLKVETLKVTYWTFVTIKQMNFKVDLYQLDNNEKEPQTSLDTGKPRHCNKVSNHRNLLGNSDYG